MTERHLIAPVTAPSDSHVLDDFLALVGPEGPELLRAIVETYVNETPRVVDGLGEALARADHGEAAWMAHRLKSRCVSIGARGLAARCAVFEAACRARALPPLAAYADLVDDVGATTRTLRAFLARLPARPAHRGPDGAPRDRPWG